MASGIFRYCLECGAVYELRQASKITTSKYCSVRCRQRGNGLIGVRAHAEKYRGTGVGYVKRNSRHEHRTIAEQMLGRPLEKGEVVHHKNGIKSDNRPENIQVCTQSVHVNLHRTNWRKSGD